jgi:pimeloyl-ACP methyl ester carboxylesterase
MEISTFGVVPLDERRRVLPEVLRAPAQIDVPIRILHGRTDVLIPFTESLHMEKALAPLSRDTTVRVTGLFSHSGEERSGGPLSRGREGLRLLDGMRGVFGLG